MSSLGAAQQMKDARQARVLTAALEVFSESSFGDATTDEIARRAHMSKRDIYAAFADKHAILAAVIEMVLQTGDESFKRVISDSRSIDSLQERLEILGLSLTGEILSPVTGFIVRLVASESLHEPAVGELFYKNWYSRRGQAIARMLSAIHVDTNKKARPLFDSQQASKHFLALIAQLPQTTAAANIGGAWNTKTIQAHVKSAVECFLNAYPVLA